MTPESFAARVRSMLADNPELTLYEKDHRLYVGYNYNDFYSDDIYITDVDL